jgi:hypothetical protein
MSATNQNESNHESDNAASTIQRLYRRHSSTALSSLALMSVDFGSVAVAAMTYDSKSRSSSSSGNGNGNRSRSRSSSASGEEHRDEYDSHALVTPEATELGFPLDDSLLESDVADVVETTECQDDEHDEEDSTEYPGEDQGDGNESKRSHLWGVAAIAGTFVGMVGLALASGPPVDEDDAIAVAAIF